MGLFWNCPGGLLVIWQWMFTCHFTFKLDIEGGTTSALSFGPMRQFYMLILIYTFYLFIYLKDRGKKKRNSWHRSSSSSFPWMPAIARTEPAASQKSEIPSGTPRWQELMWLKSYAWLWNCLHWTNFSFISTCRYFFKYPHKADIFWRKN